MAASCTYCHVLSIGQQIGSAGLARRERLLRGMNIGRFCGHGKQNLGCYNRMALQAANMSLEKSIANQPFKVLPEIFFMFSGDKR